MIRKTHLAAGALILVAGAGAFLAYELREPDAQRIEFRLDELVMAGPIEAGSELALGGSLSGADECTVRWDEFEFRVESGEFARLVPVPGPGDHMVWTRAICDGVEVPPIARRLVVAPQSEGSGESEPVSIPVIRLTAEAKPLVEPATEFALEAANREVSRYLTEEIQGAEIITLDVPAGRVAASLEQWAGTQLGGAAGERVAGWIPDDIADVALEMRWAPETSVELSNLKLQVGDDCVDATLSLALTIGVAVEATEEGQAPRQWDPPPMDIDLAHVGARFDLSEWPTINVSRVNLLGDLCERPDGRFWRRRCRDVMPRVIALVERPIERALNDRAAEWIEGFSFEEALIDVLAPTESWATLMEESGAELVLAELSTTYIAFEGRVSSDWLGTPRGLEAGDRHESPLVLEISSSFFNRALFTLFDRPLHEVPGHTLQRTEELAPGQAEALERVVADLDGLGRLDGAWTETLALTNLQMESSVHLVPFIPDGGHGLRFAVHGVRLFRGVDREDVGLSLSAELPVEIVAPESGFELRPDATGLLRNLALEPTGPESTTRADARRFAAFLNTEIARNFGDDPELPLVDLSGVVDGFQLVPVIPRAFTIAGSAVTLESFAYDSDTATFRGLGSAELLDPSDDE